jgi:hypothetical protein
VSEGGLLFEDPVLTQITEEVYDIATKEPWRLLTTRREEIYALLRSYAEGSSKPWS